MTIFEQPISERLEMSLLSVFNWLDWLLLRLKSSEKPNLFWWFKGGEQSVRLISLNIRGEIWKRSLNNLYFELVGYFSLTSATHNVHHIRNCFFNWNNPSDHIEITSLSSSGERKSVNNHHLGKLKLPKVPSFRWTSNVH